MSSPVSYANIAKGQVPEQEMHEVSGEASRSETSGVKVTSTEEPQEAGAATEEPTELAEPAETKEKEAAAKEKKPLAPAPVPSKSAWGSAANVNHKPVDEHKWPTPDKASLSDQQAASTQKQQKFIKPITNKWVPINAKVILPSGRTNSQKQKQNKKNKKGGNTQKKQANNQSSQNTQNNNTNMQVNQPAVGITKREGQFENPEQAQQPHDGFKPRPNGQFQGQSGQGQQKNMRRFNGNTNGSFKPRFPNQPPSQQQQQPSPQQNGFYHPQPFVQNQNYQNFNNRQFRPNQFRHQNNRNSFHQPMNGSNGFINTSMGLPQQIPQQIPPPISPKQDPQQALTQQIDYYFSLENLIKDIFLRKNMNTEGWVSLSLILNFKRVKIIINGIQNSIENKEISSSTIILDSLKHCENLEINYLNGKDLQSADIDDIELRVKGNYEQWLLPNDN